MWRNEQYKKTEVYSNNFGGRNILIYLETYVLVFSEDDYDNLPILYAPSTWAPVVRDLQKLSDLELLLIGIEVKSRATHD